MLKEIHHRVKNNLQVITSLLSLQASAARGQHARLLARARTGSQHGDDPRKALPGGSEGKVDMSEYVRGAHDVPAALYAGRRVSWTSVPTCQNVMMDMEPRCPAGSSSTELVSNALKYAFPAAGKAAIRIGFRSGPDGRLTLSVSDDRDRVSGRPSTFALRRRSACGS